MPNLGLMLAGSAIGQGAGNFVQGQAQGTFDRARLDQMQTQNAQTQKVNDFQNTQMDRTLQEQQIGDTPVDGETDGDRLRKTAALAAGMNRGDKQRYYLGLADKADQDRDHQLFTNAGDAVLAGQFDKATQLLNQTKTYKGVQSIGLANDLVDAQGNPIPQDPNNPTYSIYTPGPPDATGNPTLGPHVHITSQLFQAAMRDPKLLSTLSGKAQATAQKNALDQGKLGAQVAHWNDQTNHWSAQDAAAMQKAKAAGSAGAAKLTDKRWLYQWAQGQIGKPGGFADDNAAMTWAMDPNRQNKDYWQANRAALDIQKSGGAFSAADLAATLHDVLNRTPIANPQAPATPAPTPAPPAAPKPAAPPAVPSLATLGAKPVAGKPGVFADPKGRHFKQQGNSILQWSPSKSDWVDVTAAITGAR